MKYRVKVEVSQQIDTNEGERGATGAPLPPNIVTLLDSKSSIDILGASGASAMTGAELKTAIKAQVKYANVVSDKLYIKEVEILDTAGVTATNVTYSITLGL